MVETVITYLEMMAPAPQRSLPAMPNGAKLALVKAEDIPLQAKSAVAARILDRIEKFLIAVPAKNAQAKA